MKKLLFLAFLLPPMLAGAGVPEVKEQLLNGYQAGDKTFKLHLDGYNMLPFFQGEVEESSRKEIFYFDAGGNLNALRYKDWKLHFTLRADHFEVSHDSALYIRWFANQMWTFMPAQSLTAHPGAQ